MASYFGNCGMSSFSDDAGIVLFLLTLVWSRLVSCIFEVVSKNATSHVQGQVTYSFCVCFFICRMLKAIKVAYPLLSAERLKGLTC